MLNLDSIKKCFRMMSATKQVYSIQANLLPAGSIVCNKLEQLDAYEKAGNKPIVSPDELATMPAETREFLMANGSVVKDDSVVLIGTRGEMWLVNTAKFVKRYTLSDGSQIDVSAMNETPITVTTVPDNSVAEFIRVPEGISFSVVTEEGIKLVANDPRVEHGDGDVVMLCGNDAWVVNGAVFEDTYTVI